MKVVFVMRHAGYVRNFESTLRLLCERGHRVHVAFQGKVKYEQLDPIDIAGRLSAQYSNFSCGEIPPRDDGWGLLGREARLGLDYLRYLRPEYRDAPKLRERATREAPPSVLARAERGVTSSAVGRAAMGMWLRGVNRAIPRHPDIDAFVQRMRPDVLALTPLIEPGSPQAEYARSARALGVRTAFCVASWDNLTNKGLIHADVDLVAVWNEAMKREAVELHGVPAHRVVVTGAAAFDHWFEWRPSRTREAFCARVGLPENRPYLLYLCSSKFVAPDEVAFVRQWVAQIRQSASPALREVGVLVRPHPQHAEQWQGVDASDLRVVVWPPAGAAPVDTESRGDYFESMYHSAAVVGINTTAQIESAILGRPVYTLLASEFRDTQDGTLHFHHLRSVNGGLLHLAHDFDEHLAQLDAAVRGPRADDPQCRRFVEAFVRPHGIDAAATPRLVAALEALAASPRRARGEPLWAPLVRWRLASHHADLERQAQALRESRAARQAAKDAREERRATREAERRAKAERRARQEEEVRTRRGELERVLRLQEVDALVQRFRELGEVDRRGFLQGAVDAFPPDAFIDVHQAAPPRKLDYEHADILMRVTTKGEQVRLRGCAKEPFTIEWIHRRIRPGDVLYDIGANVGVYSLVAAKKPGGGARVVSFEASYATVGSLCANIVLNQLAGQIMPLPIALSDATGMNVFSLRDLKAGAARHALGYDPPEDGPTLYQQPVLMFTLDDVIEMFQLPLPNHIKLDVDGGELAVLRGAVRTLRSPSLHSMLVEVSTTQSGEVTELLAGHGLRLDSKIAVTNKAGDQAVWYGLFARETAASSTAASTVASDAIQR
jgi:FkbM family methyltransferase